MQEDKSRRTSSFTPFLIPLIYGFSSSVFPTSPCLFLVLVSLFVSYFISSLLNNISSSCHFFLIFLHWWEGEGGWGVSTMTFWLNWEIYLTVLLCSNKQLIRPASARGMYVHKCFVYSFVCVCQKDSFYCSCHENTQLKEWRFSTGETKPKALKVKRQMDRKLNVVLRNNNNNHDSNNKWMTQRATLSAHIISPTMKMILAWTDGNMDLIKSPLQRLCHHHHHRSV